jgi:hypothetical protein
MDDIREVPCQLAFEFDAPPVELETTGPANVESNVVQVFFGYRRSAHRKQVEEKSPPDHAAIVNQVLLDARMLRW